MKWRELLPDSAAELASHLKLERVKILRDGRQMLISFLADRLFEESDYLVIKKAYQKAFRPIQVSLHIASPELKPDFQRNVGAYVGFMTDCLARDSAGIRPMLADSAWIYEDERLYLTAASEACRAYLEEAQVPMRLAMLMRDVFRLDAQVVLRERTDELEQQARMEALWEATAQDVADQVVFVEREKKEKKPQAKILGRQIADPVLPINELTMESGKVTICGEVLKVECKELKGGEMKLLVFDVTDLEGTMPCKTFLRYRRRGSGVEGPPTQEEIAQVEAVVSAVTQGAYLKVRGECQWDKFSNETTLMVNDINRAVKPVREDLGQEKRVELHLHTQMSSMDGMASVSALIKQAAAWGHPAIAVTDHGVVQAFPDAFAAARKNKIKLIPGVEGYLSDESEVVLEADGRSCGEDIVVLDFETTGLSPQNDRVIEIGAVRIHNGQIVDELSIMVHPGRALPEKIVEITGITDVMLRDAQPFEAHADVLLAFLGDAAIAAHNASFDLAFLKNELSRCGREWQQPVIDTLAFARKMYPALKSHRLGALCKKLGISLKNAHRAVHDARATAKLLLLMLEQAKAQGIDTLTGLNTLADGGVIGQSHHIILLAKSQQGMTNLNRLVSEGHLNYFYRRPHMPRQLIEKYREGLIVGSACEAGELFQAVLDGKSDAQLRRIAAFYDYLEIQPVGNNAFMVRNGRVPDEEALRALNRKIVALGDAMGKPVVATGDVHFLNPEDERYRAILMAGMGFEDADEQAPLYFRTTDDMLAEFAYLGEDKAYEVVIGNPRAIADQVGDVRLFPEHPEGKETFQPFWEDAADNIQSLSYEKARALYGDQLPELVEARLEKELKAIIGYGFATLYDIARKLVNKSVADGYMVGSRGSVGSSFVATMCGITEVNPLPPHYRCPSCRWTDFDVKDQGAGTGVDLAHRDCPECGTACVRDGYDIPFEVFLGFKGDKVPDIDLNFSSVYQPRAHKYVEELFGAENVFRAGTIGTLADKTAYGFVSKYFEQKGVQVGEAEKNRLVAGCVGVKRTTGQHPGGMVVLPKDYEIYQFTAVQRPADATDSLTVTTHYDFGSMHDVLVKLDILGHDDPTMVRMLEDLTGVNAMDIPLDDPKVLSLFSSPEALGVTAEVLGCMTGTYGIPEFGTAFVRKMLEETRPTTMHELLCISGLSHGTDVWAGNAQELVRDGVAALKDCICTREDIMNYLLSCGVETKIAFDTMESVRKGKGLQPFMEEAMAQAHVPDWIVGSLKKIKYMFPRGHAVAYVTMALRVGYWKVYYPQAYYAAFFTVRAKGFDIVKFDLDVPGLRRALAEWKSQEEMKKKLTAIDKEQIKLTELVLEMKLRGIDFVPMDLYRSDSENFIVTPEGLLPPFSALAGVGGSAAEAIVQARAEREFLSVEDLQARTRLSNTALELLRGQGCFSGMAETSQVSLF